jgi:hypothetical protein
MSLIDKIHEPTELQEKICEVITGYEAGEVVHAFEVIKLIILFKKTEVD